MSIDHAPYASRCRASRPDDVGAPEADQGWYASAKPVTDAVAAAVLLILTSWLIALAIVLVKLSSRGPAIYSQVRVGRRNRLFTIYKIRTMRHRCEDGTGAVWCKPRDSRITLIGRILRKTHVDELPQLWNVLRGDMSLVGPRPERPEFIPDLEAAFPRYTERLAVRPGLTGLAQLQEAPDTSLESVRRKLVCDLHYVRNVSLWMDLRLLAGTAFHVVGIPFAVSGRLLSVPRREAIERVYRSAESGETAHYSVEPA